jgi:hypothetical protein
MAFYAVSTPTDPTTQLAYTGSRETPTFFFRTSGNDPRASAATPAIARSDSPTANLSFHNHKVPFAEVLLTRDHPEETTMAF